MMQIIILTGLKGHGKSTAAKHLVNQHGFIEISFADVLKDVVSAVFLWDREMVEGLTDESRVMRELPDPYWSSILNIKNFTPRRALTLIGTDIFRKYLNDNIWTHIVKRRLMEIEYNNPNAKVVISDARFPNEIRIITEAYTTTTICIRNSEIPDWYKLAKRYNQSFGIQKVLLTWRYKILQLLHKPSLFDIHSSERSMPGYAVNYVVNNISTKEKLYEEIDMLLTTIAK